MSQPASMLQTLESYINTTSDRHKLVVKNMANIDTPGYKTKDIDFRNEFSEALSGQNAVSEEREVPGLIERPDGNNVSLDREGLALSETQLQFKIGVQLIRTEFHRLLTAINEGKQ